MENVNNLSIGELSEGDHISFEHRVTEGQIDEYAGLTGDVSPLHLDGAFARSRGFSNRVAHGMLLGGLFSRIVGVHLPGENALLQAMNVKFHSPVYPGDTLVVHARVSQISTAAGAVILEAAITNKESGEKISSAKIWVGFTKAGGRGGE